MKLPAIAATVHRPDMNHSFRRGTVRGLVALLCAGTAVAAPAIDLASWSAPGGDESWSATRLLDLEVRDVTGETVGEVEDIVVDADGRVAAIVLEVGGLADIGDVHVRAPWDEIGSVDAIGSLQYVALPVREGGLDDLGTADDVELARGEWRATELIGDGVSLVDSAPDERGRVRDLLFGTDGTLEAVLVDDLAGAGDTGPAYPFFGYDYGFEPLLDNYILPYAKSDLGADADRPAPDAIVLETPEAPDAPGAPDAQDALELARDDVDADSVTLVTEPVEVATFERPEDGGSGDGGGERRQGDVGGDAGDPDTLEISLDAEALFAFDSAELAIGVEQALVDLLVTLEGLDGIAAIEVTGHTDSVGPEDYNLALSRSRAQAVADFIAADYPNIDIVATGVGETRPQAPNDTPEGRQLNRRVDVVARRD